jgi:hypothetical protein
MYSSVAAHLIIISTMFITKTAKRQEHTGEANQAITGPIHRGRKEYKGDTHGIRCNFRLKKVF